MQKVQELCEQSEYKNRTMGVISLQGKEPARLIEELLREILGEREMIDRT